MNILDENNWRDKKIESVELSYSYKRLGMLNKYQRVNNCAGFLEFCLYEDGQRKLQKANFCKNRLCSMCNWRRSKKIFSQVSQIIAKIDEDEGDIDYIFLTLTVKNCELSDLSDTISEILTGYKRFSNDRRIKKAYRGIFRALEITYNNNKYKKAYNTWHPHLHCIIAVDKNYFDKSNVNYLSYKNLQEIWQRCVRADYLPQVDIRKIKNAREKAVAEVAKYTVKSNTYLMFDKEKQDNLVRILDDALFNRRLVSYSGIFKKYYKLCGLSDAVDGDLVHTDGEKLDERLVYVVLHYRWHIGFYNYYESTEFGDFLE